MRHGVMSADLAKIAAINAIVGETAINQPRLVEVWMSCVDVCQLYCYQILHLTSHNRIVLTTSLSATDGQQRCGLMMTFHNFHHVTPYKE